MIPKKELRIGNYILVGILPSKVKTLRAASIETDGANVYYKTAKPIPLTPEILEKSGFVKRTDPDSLHISYEIPGFPSHEVMLRQMRQGYLLIFAGKVPIPKRKILFVHQFQNLMFCLTGEDLPITL